MRYLYHPESESLWTEEDDSPRSEADGLVEELTKEQYEAKMQAIKDYSRA